MYIKKKKNRWIQKQCLAIKKWRWKQNEMKKVRNDIDRQILWKYVGEIWCQFVWVKLFLFPDVMLLLVILIRLWIGLVHYWMKFLVDIAKRKLGVQSISVEVWKRGKTEHNTTICVCKLKPNESATKW